MIDEIIQISQTRMNKSVEALKSDLSKLRTGRAHPALLDHIIVSYYGQETPLKQVANVAIEDARTLSVTPWEKPMIPVIEKAIISSELGLNPTTVGNVIRLPLPLLTEDRRKEMVRLVRGEAESARIAIRNIRRDANNDMKDLLKEKAISEDEDRRAQEKIQDITNKMVQRVDELLASKEKELMEV